MRLWSWMPTTKPRVAEAAHAHDEAALLLGRDVRELELDGLRLAAVLPELFQRGVELPPRQELVDAPPAPRVGPAGRRARGPRRSSRRCADPDR